METRLFYIFFITTKIITVTVSAQDYGSFHDEDFYDNQEHDLPKFLSKGQRFSVETGGTITFPCEVEKMSDDYMLMFKFVSLRKKDKTLFAGDIPTGRFPRIRKIGNSFILSRIKKSDAGTYICRFESDPVEEIVHQLDVQYPAEVTRIGEGVEKVAKGSPVTLQCNATGNPFPAISWSKEDGRLPSGAQSEEGQSITLENVDRHVEGTYICTASNGIGEPDSARITLEVEYKPDIVTEQEILQKKDRSFEAQLVCIVHGRPKPKLTWYRGEELVSSNKHIMHHDGNHRHSLQINDVDEADFGTYSCLASNTHGEASSNITLTGSPKAPNITSSPSGGEKEFYTLTWTTESYTPIIQYRLKYRKFRNNRVSSGPDRWIDENFLPPKVTERDARISEGLQEMQHRLRNLMPAVDYEAKISVENKFGWSPESRVFKFHTRKEMAVGRSASSSEMAKIYPALLVAALAAVGTSSNSAQTVHIFAGLLLCSLVASLL